ncbi:hypothetical protein CFC21_035438 [Triticum aestivum]|uniref:Protein kinase domain-containing protein n=3 Tax=Triticum TaxID=4564 RepID=A0A9R0VJS7_TRITD|nr:hypothetical protein CFC21_035438 [Triticum aestivum]VAH61616.1 unnamed protein product [Triticum turgidum subsp. durum]
MAVAVSRAVLLAAVASLACLAFAEPPPSERSALLAFLTATPHERRLGWNTSTPACSWVGVTCDAAQSTVVQLRLPGVGLVGAIPPATISRLPNLQVLSLRSNRIIGGIPDDLLQLSSLRAIFLQNNMISGAIPSGVGKLAALERLVLSHNNLSGPIPFALNSLASLRSLRLEGNRLSGKIPSITNPELKDFNVSVNSLNGSIPQALARFPADSFAGNLQLCGKPLPACSPFFPSYKAVLEEGTTVVVKRLKDVAVARREFDAHMEALGRVEHRNLLPVRAYYFSKDEKLLVYDYLPNGSLSAMLHGSRGSGRTPMDWDARMLSALSASRGLAHLHSAHNLAHGNVKSSNVLLRPDYDAAALSDFCLHPIFAPSSTRAGAGGYRAPEVVDTRRPTFKADVYSLGVLLLELLTGKSPTHASLEGDGTLDLPRWVQSVVREEWTAEVFDVELVRLGASAEEEMVALLQVAMACVATVPDARPDAPDVVRMIEEIGGGHGQTTTEESARGTPEEERSRGTPPAAPTP